MPLENCNKEVNIMKHEYSILTKEEIQMIIYDFLSDYIKVHTYISTKTVGTIVKKKCGYKQTHTDPEGTAFKRKFTRNLKVIFMMFETDNKIEKSRNRLYKRL